MKLKVVDVSTKYLCTCVLLEYTPVTKLTVDFFFKESWRRVKNYYADFVRKRTPPKSVTLFLPWDKKQVFRGKKYHFQLFWRNLIGTLFKLIDPFPVKPHWHLHEIIYIIEDPIFPLIQCFVCVWKLSVAKMANSTLGIMDVEHFAQNMQ